MNIERIEKACSDIVESAKALDWLLLIRGGIGISPTVNAPVTVRIDFVGEDRSGAAERVLGSRVKFIFPDLIEQSIKDCHDTFERSYAVLQQELAPPRVPHPEGAAQ